MKKVVEQRKVSKKNFMQKEISEEDSFEEFLKEMKKIENRDVEDFNYPRLKAGGLLTTPGALGWLISTPSVQLLAH